MIKKLTLLLVLSMLSGCVTYYYPAYEDDDSLYYADDYSANTRGYVGISVDYDRYDPWYYPYWSLDHFYLGGHHNRFYFSAGYYDPWYLHYRPWRSSYWSYGYYCPPYYRGRRGYLARSLPYEHRYGDYDQYYGQGRDYDPYDRREDRRDTRNGRYSQSVVSNGRQVIRPGSRRTLPAAGAAGNGNRPVVISSKGNPKVVGDRITPVRDEPRKPLVIEQRRPEPPRYERRIGSTRIISRGNDKPVRDRLTPVRSGQRTPYKTKRPLKPRQPTVVNRPQPGKTIRYRSGGKAKSDRLTPVRPISKTTRSSAAPRPRIPAAPSRSASQHRGAVKSAPAPRPARAAAPRPAPRSAPVPKPRSAPAAQRQAPARPSSSKRGGMDRRR